MDNSSTGIELIDARNRLVIEDDRAVIQRTQDIDDRFLSNLASERVESSNAPMGDFHHVCSIPTVVIEKWMAEGFNIFDQNVTAQDIIKRLQSQDMTGLMATTKRLI
jgi:hypothetical protein